MGTGTVSFQANDKMDVFYVARLKEEGIESSDESIIQVEDSQFEGDTSIINAWFKGESFEHPFVITVYVECETAEELEEVTADEELEQSKNDKADFLEPTEIHLWPSNSF